MLWCSSEAVLHCGSALDALKSALGGNIYAVVHFQLSRALLSALVVPKSALSGILFICGRPVIVRIVCVTMQL